MVNERDILGTQLIRRNDELALLYEKIKIQQVSWGARARAHVQPRRPPPFVRASLHRRPIEQVVAV